MQQERSISSAYYIPLLRNQNEMDGWMDNVETVDSPTPVISKSKDLSKILRDICTLTYQICRFEEKINQTTTFHI